MSERRAIESHVPVGKAFNRPFTVTVPASWGTPTGTPVLTVYRLPAMTDVTSTTTSGTTSVNGQIITTKSVLRSGMTAGEKYKAVVEFALSAGGTDSCFWEMECEE